MTQSAPNPGSSEKSEQAPNGARAQAHQIALRDATSAANILRGWLNMPASRDDLRAGPRGTTGLTGPEKAVLLLLALDEDAGTPIMAALAPAEVRRLHDVASSMRVIHPSAIDQVCVEFAERSGDAFSMVHISVQSLRSLVTQAHGESKSIDIFQSVAPSNLTRLANAPAANMAAYLESEHPQLVAAILSQLAPMRAARVLEALPTEMQPQVLARLGTMKELSPKLLECVATALSADLPLVQATKVIDGVGSAAKLVRKLNKTVAGELLEQLTRDQAEIANEIRRSLYSFDDLKALDRRALQVLLREVPSERLAVALKKASDELKNHIFSGMSSRAAQLLQDDLAGLTGVRSADVETAQREIIEIALRLEGEGAITLGGDGEARV